MADPLTDALEYFVAACPHVRSTRDLVTKIRLELEERYVLDLYFRETTAQYSYSLHRDNQRVLGWDNAPPYPDLSNAPHHFHREDGEVEASTLKGDPVQDISIVVERINALYVAKPDDNPAQ